MTRWRKWNRKRRAKHITYRTWYVWPADNALALTLGGKHRVSISSQLQAQLVTGEIGLVEHIRFIERELVDGDEVIARVNVEVGA